MTETYLLTVPRLVPKKAICLMIQNNDCKKWTIGYEEGTNGYRHYQIRLVSSNHDFFEWCKAYLPTAHVEKAATKESNYERKSGYFISSDDTNQIRSVRFGTLTTVQKEILKKADEQNDREITIIVDNTARGGHGKTWLSINLYERGKALVVPRSQTTSEKLSAYICSAYRREPYIIVDIPRSRKTKEEIYEALEEIKDGLVFDHRYRGNCRDIRGVRIIVFMNEEPNYKALSTDRWNVWFLNDFGLYPG